MCTDGTTSQQTLLELEQIVELNKSANLNLPTPLVPLGTAAFHKGKPVLLKLDSLTASGSYKLRGTAHAVRQTKASARGYVAASTGNHAIAVALAAGNAGKPSIICVPSNISFAKLQMLFDAGIRTVVHEKDFKGHRQETAKFHELMTAQQSAVYIVDGDFPKAQETAARLGSKLKLKSIHPYDDEHGFVGHKSIGVELRDQLTELGYAGRSARLVFPAGGGGYGPSALQGCQDCGIEAKLTLVELEGQDCCNYALSMDRYDPSMLPAGITDFYVPSTAVSKMGGKGYQVARQEKVEVLTVSRGEVQSGYRQLIRRLRAQTRLDHVKIELAPAMAYAGLLRMKEIKEDVIVLAISGGNMSGAEADRVMRDYWQASQLF